MREAVAILAVLPVVSPRARKFALEATQRRVRGMGDGFVSQGQASDATKNQISRWAKAAAEGDDRAAYQSAVDAMSRTAPWGDASPWYTSVNGGGWYAYSDVTTMLSTTVAERHPDWVTAASFALSMSPTGAVIQSLDPNASDAIVNAGGGALNQARDAAVSGLNAADKAACAAIPGATWNEETQTCTPPSAASIKKILVAVALGLIAAGAGYVAIKNYALGRGLRPAATNPRLGHRTPRRTRRARRAA